MTTTTINTSGINPLGQRVLVKPDPIEEMTEGGIIVPDSARKQHGQAQYAGTVIAVGEFAFDDFPCKWVMPGDRVLFARHQGQLLTGEDGEAYRVLNDLQIICTVTDGVTVADMKTRQRYGDAPASESYE